MASMRCCRKLICRLDLFIMSIALFIWRIALFIWSVACRS